MTTCKHFVTTAILLSFQPSHAFDGARSGFMIGIGADYQTIDTDYTYYGSELASDSYTGPATSLKIDWGVTEQLLLYYVRNASWYSAPYSDGGQTKDITVLLGIRGFGGTYHFPRRRRLLTS